MLKVNVWLEILLRILRWHQQWLWQVSSTKPWPLLTWDCTTQLFCKDCRICLQECPESISYNIDSLPTDKLKISSRSRSRPNCWYIRGLGPPKLSLKLHLQLLATAFSAPHSCRPGLPARCWQTKANTSLGSCIGTDISSTLMCKNPSSFIRPSRNPLSSRGTGKR